jgi:predicted solute-binding protein
VSGWQIILGFLGSAGLGAVIKSIIDHFLNHRHDEAELSDKAVETAERMLTRYEQLLTMADRKLAEADHLIGELRTDLAGLRYELLKTRQEYADKISTLQSNNRTLEAELIRHGLRPLNEGT